MVHDGLVSSFDGRHMVEQASFVSRELGISRDEQDAWAYRSQRRAVEAIDAGRFADEIVPVGKLVLDEAPRRDTTLEKLATLEPLFDPQGSTTAGNAPGVNDGASCLVITSEAWARGRGIEPLATILAQGMIADDYAFLARTPARASAVALEAAGRTIDDVARIEINEAFSSVASHSTRAARSRRGAGQRQRRGGRARPSDRCVRRAGFSRRLCTSCGGTAADSASRRSAQAGGRATRS